MQRENGRPGHASETGAWATLKSVAGIVLGLLLLGVAELRVLVRAPSGQPLQGAQIEIAGSGFNYSGRSGPDGILLVAAPSQAPCRVRVFAEGYYEAAREVIPPAEVEFVLAPRTWQSQRIEVQAPVDPAQAPSVQSISATPQRPATVRDALPLIPGVTRTVEGKLIISDAAEHRSTLLLNSLDATDPVTGRFGATVPIDAVAAFNLEKNPFLAEYGRFSTGVVTIETRRAADRWQWLVNDPTPELRIRSRHLRGIRAFTPRLSFGGPLRRGLYFWQSLEYVFKETPVRTQPYPRNEVRRQAWNLLAQLDYYPSGTRSASLTLHLAPERLDYAQLSLYNPQQATSCFRGREWMVAATNRVAMGSGLVEIAMSYAAVTGYSRPQGTEGLRMFPDRNEGHYPFWHARDGRRWQCRATYAAPRIAGHQVKVGGWLLGARARGHWQASEVSVWDMAGRRLRHILFRNRPPFRKADTETSWYAHDEWLGGKVRANIGLRSDFQAAANQLRWAPRLSLAWSPLGDERTTLQAGYGWFYERVPLNVFGFPNYPEIVEGQPRPNVLEAARLSPHARVWSAQWDQRACSLLHLRVRYTLS